MTERSSLCVLCFFLESCGGARRLAMQDQRDLDQNEGHQVPGTWYLLYRGVIYGAIRYSVLLGSFIEHIYYYLYCIHGCYTEYVVSTLYASLFCSFQGSQPIS